MMMMKRIARILGLVVLFVVSFAGDDDYVRIVLESPSPSPFALIRYEITQRAPATTAVHRRLLPGVDEGLHSLGLLTKAEAEEAFALVRDVSATTLPDAAPASGAAGALTWRVKVLVDGKPHEFVVTDPENLPDRRYQRLIDGVRRTVLSVTDPLPFRNVFFSPSRRGWLNIVSVPAARVFVDGFDTQHETPLYSYEVPAGAHTIRMVSIDGTLDRSYEVRVEPGGATNLRVDLR